jgi:hypothetical protein
VKKGIDISVKPYYNEVTTKERHKTKGGNKMKVVIVEPYKKARVEEIGSELEDLQGIVGGYIEAVYPFDDPVAIVCNGEGKFNGSAPNRALYDERGQVYDIIHGTFFVCGLGLEDFASLTDELAEKYLQRFGKPEDFLNLAGRIVVIK